MEKVMSLIEWCKLHWDLVSFVALFLTSEILPKIQKVDANSIHELIPELCKLVVKLIKKDYKVDEPSNPN